MRPSEDFRGSVLSLVRGVVLSYSEMLRWSAAGNEQRRAACHLNERGGSADEGSGPAVDITAACWGMGRKSPAAVGHQDVCV